MKNNEFVVSDTHFSHNNIIKYCNRPFVDKYEMNEKMIMAWNNKVPYNGIVYHLGDLSFGTPEETLKILNRLNGTIRLILGNHDRISPIFKSRFEWIKEYYESKTENGRKIIMFHYPIFSWNGASKGSWHFHGHCHHSIEKHNVNITRFDVGVDSTPQYTPQTPYAPYSFQELKRIMEKRIYKITSHHGQK